MPNSPELPHSLFRTEAEIEELQELGYDSDGYLPPFKNPDEDFDFNEDSLVSIEAGATPVTTHPQQPPPLTTVGTSFSFERDQQQPPAIPVMPPLVVPNSGLTSSTTTTTK
jgi:hypothetical protein